MNLVKSWHGPEMGSCEYGYEPWGSILIAEGLLATHEGLCPMELLQYLVFLLLLFSKRGTVQ
jgi:hypothetical protein